MRKSGGDFGKLFSEVFRHLGEHIPHQRVEGWWADRFLCGNGGPHLGV